MHGHIRVGDERSQIVGAAADDLSGEAPLERDADLVDRFAVNDHRLLALSHQRPRFDPSAFGLADHPAAIFNAMQRGKLRADLNEHRRHQLIEPGVKPRHRTAEIMLGDAERASDDRKVVFWIASELVPRQVGEVTGCRVVLRFAVQQVPDGRLDRLIMSRQRRVFRTARREQPGQPVRVHDKRLVAADGLHADRVGRGAVRRVFVHLEIRLVVAVPLFLFLIPENQLLALRPRITCRVRRGPVV